MEELEAGLKQRDDMIQQLSDNLKATTENRDTLQSEYSIQAQQLAQQVHTLQLQLQQVMFHFVSFLDTSRLVASINSGTLPTHCQRVGNDIDQC